jgi:hypothetical protein
MPPFSRRDFKKEKKDGKSTFSPQKKNKEKEQA